MQWRLFEGLQALGFDDLPVLEAESVQRDSGTVMRRFWQLLDLPDRPEALNWESDAVPRDWKYVEGWHQSVSASAGIRKLSQQEEDARQAQFDEACREAPWLADYLEHHLPFYRKLCAHSLTRGQDDG